MTKIVPVKAQPARSSKDQFDRQATHYNAQWNSWSAQTLDWMIANSDVTATDMVLDMATGSGFTAIAFAKQAASVTGADVSTGMLAEARKRALDEGQGNVTFVESTAEQMPFDDESFDIVTCRIAAHHFLDVRLFLSEVARVLKRGGRFILADTTIPGDDVAAGKWQNAVEVVRDPSHIRNYTPGEWQTMAETAGLTVKALTDGQGGITIPLDDWISKAGCTPDQEADVRRRFAEAADSAREAFRITVGDDGKTVFTWKRVLMRADKV